MLDRMDPVFVLVHSPSVGPSTWTPVAEALRSRGRAAVVPSLLQITAAGPPYWPHVVTALTESVPVGPLVLVAHSNAGLFVPAIAEILGDQVTACLFADAALPPPSGPVRVAEPEFIPFLRELSDEAGVLPRWTDWWPEEEVAAMLPDEATRRTVVAEQPRLPLDYYLQEIPVPSGWDRVPCAYLWYGEPYGTIAKEAGRRGWPVRHIPGAHLHQLLAPEAVADWMIGAVKN
jgi:pimeloyl-ACP methyl ester carboxylesterase